jgi:hypothetical protein
MGAICKTRRFLFSANNNIVTIAGADMIIGTDFLHIRHVVKDLSCNSI